MAQCRRCGTAPGGTCVYRDLLQKELSKKMASDEKAARFDFSRRDFLATAAGAGLLGSLLPGQAAGATRPTESRTLFFNFSHHPDCALNRYYLVMGARRFSLVPAAQCPSTVRYHKRHNKFLSMVPDSAMTHVLEDADLPADAIQLGYVTQNPNPATGEWSMGAMLLNIPTSAFSHAYRLGIEMAGAGNPLWRSLKRQKYGQPRAWTLDELLEEQALLDTTSHAATIVGMHPEILNCDPNGAAHIHTSYINTGATAGLELLLTAYGAATPQVTPGQPNPTGWATLVPLLDENGVIMKNISDGSNAGLNHYNAEWNPKLADTIARSMASVSKLVKSDETLGNDVTDIWTNNPPDSQITGTIWHRKDGSTSIDQSPSATLAAVDPVAYTFTAPSTDMGYDASANVVTNTDGTITVTFSYENWFNRWVGAFVQFVDGSGNVINLPAGFNKGIFGNDTTMFLGMMSPALEVCGIPCFSPTKASYTFTFPTAQASGARLIAATLGAAPHNYSDLAVAGIVCTTIFNLVIPTVLITFAVAEAFTPFIRLVIIPSINFALTEINEAITDAGGQVGFNNLLTIFERSLARAAPASFIFIIGNLLKYTGIALFANAIPVAGQIIQGIAIAGLSSELGQTIGECAAGNSYYENDLTLTHTVSVSLAHDPQNDRFPETATTYKVNAIPDKGKPFTQTLSLPAGTVCSLPNVVFQNVPIGGKIKVTSGFYADTGWQAGHGETDLIDNVPGIEPGITLTQTLVPLGPNTVYQHKQKTALEGDSRIWQAAPAPAANPNPSCEAGNICDFGNITVRQGTGTTDGYVGYSWKGNSTAVSGCASGGIGELDQVANISTGDNPQSGYVNAPCGLQPGTKLVYSLLGKSPNNFYLDSASRIVRQIVLDPPQVDDPRQGKAWAMLNFDSDDLLLHPSGRLVSINNEASVLEGYTLKTAVADSDAPTKVIANIQAGPGTRPGRVSAPIASAISPEGVVLVLESDTHRIQALDISANPVQYFKQQNRPYYLPLAATNNANTRYLDLAVEYSGFIYVLSYDILTNAYRLDIYHPTQADGNPIATTMSFNASRITVDYWRNVYALNYEVLRTSNGFIEPGVSLWVPSTP